MRIDSNPLPTWGRWLIIGTGAMLVVLVVLGVAVFLWPWVNAFS
jgi:hypothetical protein